MPKGAKGCEPSTRSALISPLVSVFHRRRRSRMRSSGAEGRQRQGRRRLSPRRPPAQEGRRRRQGLPSAKKAAEAKKAADAQKAADAKAAQAADAPEADATDAPVADVDPPAGRSGRAATALPRRRVQVARRLHRWRGPRDRAGRRALARRPRWPRPRRRRRPLGRLVALSATYQTNRTHPKSRLVRDFLRSGAGRPHPANQAPAPSKAILRMPFRGRTQSRPRGARQPYSWLALPRVPG